MKERTIYLILIVFFILLMIFGVYIKSDTVSKKIQDLLTPISFVFGVILAFAIANRQSRLGAIRQKLREQDAIMADIYFRAKSFSKDITNSVRHKIDELLISEIDYKLIDFDRDTAKKIKEFHFFVQNIRPVGELQSENKKKMIEDVADIIKIEKEVVYQVNNRMMNFEWASLIVLGAIILFNIVSYLEPGNIFVNILICLVSTAYLLLFLILYELDTLRWQENNWIWGPLTIHFIELDLLPYYPEMVFDKRADKKYLKGIEGLKQVRVAHYPYPYPNMNGKKVTIRKI